MPRLTVIVLLAGFVNPATAADSRNIDIAIENRVVSSPGQVIRVTEGEKLALRWSSDEAVELHLHGYDVEVAVKAGQPAEMEFEANVSGRFPVTSHGFAGQHNEHAHGHKTLLYIEVYPE